MLSAFGIGLADAIVMRQRTAEVPLAAESLEGLRAPFAMLEHEAGVELMSQGFAMDAIQIERSVLVKYGGTDSTLTLPLTAESTADSLRAEFLELYRVRYGFHMADRDLVIETLSVSATGRTEQSAAAKPRFTPRPGGPKPAATRSMYFDGAWRDTPIYSRETLRPGDVIAGPAAISEPNTTVIIEQSAGARPSPTLGHLVLDKAGAAPIRAASSTRADPVLLEIFNNLFMAIAEQMGVTLANTASSVNIKERLDFSCAHVRCRRPAHRERAAHARSPGQHG